jgi:hypothetical protein
MVLVGDPVLSSDFDALTDKPYTPYTPTTSGITLGTGGLITGRYHDRGNHDVHVIIYIILGTGGVMSSNPYFSLPFSAAADQRFIDSAVYTIGGTRYLGHILMSGLSALLMRVSPGSEAIVGITATTPATWASGSIVNASFNYERA